MGGLLLDNSCIVRSDVVESPVTVHQKKIYDTHIHLNYQPHQLPAKVTTQCRPNQFISGMRDSGAA